MHVMLKSAESMLVMLSSPLMGSEYSRFDSIHDIRFTINAKIAFVK